MIGGDQLGTGSRLLEVTVGLPCGLAARTSQEKQFSASGARLRELKNLGVCTRAPIATKYSTCGGENNTLTTEMTDGDT
jgi:hypothetical protein